MQLMSNNENPDKQENIAPFSKSSLFFKLYGPTSLEASRIPNIRTLLGKNLKVLTKIVINNVTNKL